MKILAVDPGYDRLGIAILEKQGGKETCLFSGCVMTSKKNAHEKRLAHIGAEIGKILKKWKPDALAIESLFLAVNQKTAMPVAEARGVCLYEAARAGLQVFEYTPLQIKVAVTGYGRSDKKQVMEMVKRLVKIPEKSLPRLTFQKKLGGYSLLQRENKSLPPTQSRGTPFRKGRILDDEYDAIAVGLTHFAYSPFSVKRG